MKNATEMVGTDRSYGEVNAILLLYCMRLKVHAADAMGLGQQDQRCFPAGTTAYKLLIKSTVQLRIGAAHTAAVFSIYRYIEWQIFSVASGVSICNIIDVMLHTTAPSCIPYIRLVHEFD
jgi:hypothetical protein